MIRMAQLQNVREKMMQAAEELEALEKELRAEGFQAIPYYLRAARSHQHFALVEVVNAISQNIANGEAEKMLGKIPLISEPVQS